MSTTAPIAIILDGGLIQDVVGIEPGQPVVIIDYDRTEVEAARSEDDVRTVVPVPMGNDEAAVRVDVVSQAAPWIARFMAEQVAATGYQATATVSLAAVRDLLVEWHEDEVTDEDEAAEYADRFIERMLAHATPR